MPEVRVHFLMGGFPGSLEMTDQDRVLILGTVRAILKENAALVITHGTDTMVETGFYLQQTLPDLHKPLILTGAMTPLGFEGSHGLQNLTESLLAVQLLPPGIYVVMHGSVYPADRAHTRRTVANITFVVHALYSFLETKNARNFMKHLHERGEISDAEYRAWKKEHKTLA